MEPGRIGFRFRAFVSVSLTLFFFVLLFTGAILFVTPPGRVANWTGWTLLGLTKHEWIGLHIGSSCVFLIASIFHLILNWRPLVHYFRSRLTKRFALRPEWIAAVLVCGVVVAGIYLSAPPFSNLMAWNEEIKHGWETPAVRPPVAHAELLSLKEVADVAGIELAVLVKNLQGAGIAGASEDVNFGELASEHGMSPDALYRLAVGGSSTSSPGRHGQGGAGAGGAGHGSGGRGLGQMTLEQVCAQQGHGLEGAIKTLKDWGIEANGQMTLRQIADAAGITPREVSEVLTSMQNTTAIEGDK